MLAVVGAYMRVSSQTVKVVARVAELQEKHAESYGINDLIRLRRLAEANK